MHLHWQVWAHDGTQSSPQQGEIYTGVVEIDLICEDGGEALKRAEELVPLKKSYILKRVSEHEEHVNP